MKYGKVTLGQVEAVWNKLGGEKGVKRFLSIDLSPWRTIDVGTCPRDLDKLKELFKSAGCQLNLTAEEMICNTEFEVATKQDTVNLVALQTIDITGHRDGNKVEDVFVGAKQLGLDRCMSDDGLLLRLQYLDQPLQERLYMGMTPIDGLIFYLQNEFEWRLGVNYTPAHPDSDTEYDAVWVFRLRK